jgi:protocatechuate 3,4-dioxygenase beta subunit
MTMVNALIIGLAALAPLLFQGEASIDGVVTKFGSGDPIPNGIVELRSEPEDRVQYTVATAEDGKYAFRNIRPGRYRLVATRTGYVRMEYGQRSAGKRGSLIDVGTGQRLANLDMALTPTAAIYGRIYGRNGEPFIKATVQALKPTYQNGQRTLTPVQSTLTNDLGEYRLFWLTPGQYYIAARAPNWGVLGDSVTLNSLAPMPAISVSGMRYSTPFGDPVAPVSVRTEGAEARFLPVYFPNSNDEQNAQPVGVAAGGNLGSIDISLTPLRTRRIRGVVIDGETGQPIAATPGYAASIQTIPAADGPTSIVNQTSGAFDVQVTQASVALTVAAPSRTGRVEIPAGESDLEGIRIIVTGGFKLSGQVRFESLAPGDRDPRFAETRVMLRSSPPAYTLSPPPESGVPDANGNFTIQSATPGDYRVNLTPILTNGPTAAAPASLQNAYVKSIRLGDTDILRDGLHLGSEPPIEPLIILLGTNPGSLSGSVVNDNRQPASEVTVTLVPDADQRLRADLYRSTATDAMGKFKFERIPPGSYKLFAWEETDGAWQDPQFIRLYEDIGKSVIVGDGASLESSLTLIPVK